LNTDKVGSSVLQLETQASNGGSTLLAVCRGGGKFAPDISFELGDLDVVEGSVFVSHRPSPPW